MIAKAKAVLRWLFEPKYFWWTAAVVAVAVVVCLRPGATERFIRVTGLILQIFGIGTVVWGISETRASFGHPTVAAKVKEWLTRFPLRRRSGIGHLVGVEGLTTTGEVTAHVLYGPENSSTEARLDALEKNIDELHRRIGETYSKVTNQTAKVAQALQQEQESRQAEDAEIQKKLEATSTGGLHISAIGAACLFVGVILSTVSVEIEKFVIPWLWCN